MRSDRSVQRDPADALLSSTLTFRSRAVDAWVDNCPQPVWRRHSDAVNSRLLARWLPVTSARRLLKTDLFDEAVSDGLFPILAERADEVYGIDVSRRVVTGAASRYPQLKALGGDVGRLPFEDESFDVVVSISTLDHFESTDDIGGALKELHRVLRPGGVLVLTLDNVSNPVVALRNALPFRVVNRVGLVPYPVGRSFGPAATEETVSRAGFEVTDVDCVMHAPRVLAIPVTEWFGAHFGRKTGRVIARGLMGFEWLASLPTASMTGHFVGVRAIKPGA